MNASTTRLFAATEPGCPPYHSGAADFSSELVGDWALAALPAITTPLAAVAVKAAPRAIRCHFFMIFPHLFRELSCAVFLPCYGAFLLPGSEHLEDARAARPPAQPRPGTGTVGLLVE